MTFTVLSVCTGNICRSPTAERLLAARLADDAAVGVSSAGTRAVVGYAMDAASARALRELGGDPDGHIARQLTTDMIRDADLVLTATAGQRSTVLQLEPAAMRRTFTLREFVRLGAELPAPSQNADADDAGRYAARVREVAELRGVADPPTGRYADDIADPIGASPTEVRACARQIDELIERTVQIIGLRARSR